MDDDDSPLEDDEEEHLVYVDFEGNTDPNTFSSDNLQINMIGFDMEHPIIQLNGKYYEGTYEDAVGTYMFFDNDKNPQVDDPTFDNIPSIKYFEKTRKILKMKRIFVKPRLEVLGDSDDVNCIPNMETIKKVGIPPRYQEEALKMWTEIRDERLEALNEYLKKQMQREEKRKQGFELESESDEDSPFAMYKPQRSEVDLNDDGKTQNDESTSSQQLAIIDPGPSTSKQSQPWTSLPTEESDNLSKSGNLGFIEAIPRKRPDLKKKHIKKSQIVSDSKIECESKSEETPVENMELDDDKSEDINADGNLSEKILDNQLKVPQSDDELLDSEKVYDKKYEKQKKMEAKMKEISERLKKVTNEKI